MRKSGKFSWLAAGAVAMAALFGMSAYADDWRDSRRGGHYDRDDRYDRRHRRDDRDFLSGVVERVDRRRGVVVLRDRRGGRPILVEMTRRHSRGFDLDDLRRGDYVTFVGDWTRGGIFEARRIDDIDRGRRYERRW